MWKLKTELTSQWMKIRQQVLSGVKTLFLAQKNINECGAIFSFLPRRINSMYWVGEVLCGWGAEDVRWWLNGWNGRGHLNLGSWVSMTYFFPHTLLYLPLNPLSSNWYDWKWNNSNLGFRNFLPNYMILACSAFTLSFFTIPVMQALLAITWN